VDIVKIRAPKTPEDISIKNEKKKEKLDDIDTIVESRIVEEKSRPSEELKEEPKQ